MKSSKKLILALSASVVALLMLAGATLALFSDTATGNATAKAGTIDLTLTALAFSNPDNVNPGDNDPKNPAGSNAGTDHRLTFTVTNDGIKSCYNRNVVIVSVTNKSGAVISPSVFRLLYTNTLKSGAYNECTTKKFVLNDKSEIDPATAVPAGKTIVAIKYVIDSDDTGKAYVLTGKGTEAYVEKETGYTTNATSYNYFFEMDRTADNTYQGCNIKVELITQVLQFRNASLNDWSTIATKVVTVSGANVNVVPNVTEKASYTQIS